MRLLRFLTPLILIAALFVPKTVHATGGEPGTFQFGYGVRGSLDNPMLDNVFESSGETGFDWIAVNYDWANHWPQENKAPNWETFDHLMLLTQKHNVAIMLSITNCPSWAKGDAGPTPRQTANLIVTLLNRYPNTLSKIELFPGANTLNGWGAPPDPANYARLLQHVDKVLEAGNLEADIIVGGLIPLAASTNSSRAIQDVDFLNGLYQAQAIDNMSIIGLRFPALEGEPAQNPATSSGNILLLRHYEKIRQTMLENGHQKGLIWITGFSWPQTLANTAENNIAEQQTRWLVEAYQQMRSQIYIGAAFFTPFNALASQNKLEHVSNNERVSGFFVHPALTQLQQQIFSSTIESQDKEHCLKTASKVFRKSEA